jgi:hypothetical protein
MPGSGYAEDLTTTVEANEFETRVRTSRVTGPRVRKVKLLSLEIGASGFPNWAHSQTIQTAVFPGEIGIPK